MRIVNQSAEIKQMWGLAPLLEEAGRTCYKSEDKITPDSADRFVVALIKRGHEAMLEHGGMTVKFVTNRGVSHELVRHRLASFAQESTRYCNYGADKFGREITVIWPWPDVQIPDHVLGDARTEGGRLILGSPREREWVHAMKTVELAYFALLESEEPPEIARGVLPTDLKTEIIVSANWREWRHILKLRMMGTTGRPHPHIRHLMELLWNTGQLPPILFDDIVLR